MTTERSKTSTNRAKRIHHFISHWRYYWRRYLGWLPLQFCMVCEGPYWGGLPVPRWLSCLTGLDEWMPCWKDYCSEYCCEIEHELLKHMSQ